MTGWAVRGVGMALVHVVARLVLALAVATWPSQGSTLRMITLIAVILVAVVWGGVDGINAYRRGDSGTDFTMLWLKASVLAGVLAGLIAWLFTTIANVAVSSNSLFFELTSGAAFTILLVFVPAVIAVTVGRWLAGRGENTQEDLRPGKSRSPERESVSAGHAPAQRAENDPDTEVFEPVPDDQRPNLSKGDEQSSTWQEPK